MILDVHAHVFPPALLAALRSGQHRDLVTLDTEAGKEFLLVEGVRRGVVPRELLDAPRRIAALDAMGVDVQLLSSWVGLILHTSAPEVAVTLARIFNDSLAELIDQHPDRYLGLGQVALQSPQDAADEVHRLVADRRFVGVEVPTAVGGADLDEPRFEPFWRAAAATRCLVLIHPDRALAGRMSGRHHLSNTVGNPAESAIAATSLVCGGVLERHPDLRICLVHGGGTLPYQIGRLDHAHRMHPDKVGSLAALPSAYAKRFYFDSLTHSRLSLELLLDFAGPDHILLGTDCPFVMGQPDPVGQLDQIPSLPADARAKILGGNLQRLIEEIRR